jgi:hypothetical protein
VSETTPAPGATTADADAAKRQKEHVEKLLARAATESSGSVEIGGHHMEYTASAAFLAVGADGLAGASGEPQAAILHIC